MQLGPPAQGLAAVCTHIFGAAARAPSPRPTFRSAHQLAAAAWPVSPWIITLKSAAAYV
jgi:hypothetical protein